MKDYKGFTLVELLAVIVVVGILSVFAVPQVFSLVEKSRDKIYVSDANKLIAKARYIMNAKSSQIVKPNNNEVIVFAMRYLEEGDFANPPGRGEYLKDYSYVVVLNNNNTYYYSVMLVEKVKGGGFKGVKLTSETDLLEKNALRSVAAFKPEDLRVVDSNSSEKSKVDVSGDVIKIDYIKDNLLDADNDVWESITKVPKIYIQS